MSVGRTKDYVKSDIAQAFDKAILKEGVHVGRGRKLYYRVLPGEHNARGFYLHHEESGKTQNLQKHEAMAILEHVAKLVP